MQLLWLFPIQAQLALDKKNSASALTALQAATPIELGQIAFITNISCLYPMYVRGEAYLAAGQGMQPRPSFRRFSTTAASSGTAGRERWRIWGWLGRMPCSQEPRREQMPMPPASVRSPLIKTSSPSGRMPIQTFQS